MIVKNLNKKFGTKEILQDVSFNLNNQDKVGLIGSNGSGKSSLLKILAGELKADSGVINAQDEKISYLKQEIDKIDYNLTILDYLKKYTGIGPLEEKLHKLEENITDDNINEYDEILNHFLSIDGYNFDINAKVVLDGLMLNKTLETKVGQLSGGEKIKVLLATVLLSDGDLLLFDEPTNNLDLKSVDYLENYIKSLNKAYIIVSHDENFLSTVTNKTFELEKGNLNIYPYNYGTYLEVKNAEYEKRKEDYYSTLEKREELKNKLNSIKTTSAQSKSRKPSDNDKIGRDFKTGRSEVKTGSMVKKLTKELSETTVDTEFREKSTYQFRINEDKDKSASKDIILKDLVCGYDDFETCNINCDIHYGDRVLIVGGNGAGKTTLIKSILGDIDTKSGTLTIGKGLKFGYIEQNTVQGINDNLSVFQYVTQGMQEFDKPLVFQTLKNFGISYDDKDKPFNEFSAGQRTKINLAKLAINQVNALILDEPTNHLDIESAQILYDALDSFTGTIIAVTHNKTLIERLEANTVINMENCIIEYGASL